MTRVVLVIALWWGVVTAASAETDPTRWDGSREGLSFRLTARTPSQMAAFYEGRGAAPQLIEAVRKACFLTAIIINKTGDIAWLDLSHWRFTDAKGETIRRYERPYWNETWERLDVPLANRAAFNWTQLPERRDLHPAESVGGNVSVQPPPGTFALEARFPKGANRNRGEIVIRIEGLQCPQDGT